MANGPTNSSGLLHHNHDVTTANPIHLNNIHPDFDKNGCGVMKGCYIPTVDECHGTFDPNLAVSYHMLNDTYLNLEIVATGSANGSYVAVGFSIDPLMGNESVIECSSLGNQNLSTKYSYNDGDPKNVRITGEENIRKNYIINDQAYYQDGKISCNAVINVGGDTGNSQIFSYNFTQNQRYYLLLAKGLTTSTGLNQHVTTCVPRQPVPLGQAEPLFDPSTCGKKKTCYLPSECYMGCNGMGFTFNMAENDIMDIEMFSVDLGPGHYVAVGFSPDSQMGGESVIECSSIGSDTYSLKFSYNVQNGDDRYNARIPGEEDIRSQYISESIITMVDSRLYCSGRINVSGSAVSNQIFAYDPNVFYYLLMASGTTTSSGLNKHFDHVVSEQPYNLSSGEMVEAINPKFNCSECGVTKGCYFPDDSSGQCSGWGFAWKYLNNTWMEMEMTKSGATKYMAVGFSFDNRMGDDYVVECSQLKNENVTWKFSYNDPSNDVSATPTNVRINNEKAIENTYFKNQIIDTTDNMQYCKALVNVGGWNQSPKVFQLDPKQMYYLLLAQGNTNETQILVHTNKVSSSFYYDLTNVKGVPPPTVPPASNKDFNCSQCASEKGCFFPKDLINCGGTGFAYMKIDNTHIQMELMTTTASSSYVAVGFNKDSKYMGPANVIECSSLGSILSMKFSYNNGNHQNNRIDGETAIESTYFTDTSYKQEDGMIYCRAIVDVGGSSSMPNIFKWDSSQSYNLLLAEGPTTALQISQHTNYWQTEHPVDLSVGGSAGKSSGISQMVRLRLIKAHAIMMIVAWICFVPTALLFARFLRASWPHVKPGGLLLWFHVHRTANFIGIILMIASFICIMTANSWKWTGPGSGGNRWSSSHTMTGLFALIFAWAQPFISFMRCNPNTPNRPIFNWTHRGIGIVAYILATTTLAIASYHFTPFGIPPNVSWNSPTLQLILVLLPIFVMTTNTIFFPILDRYQDKEDHNHSTLEMLRQVIVLVTVGLLLGDGIALSVMVAM